MAKSKRVLIVDDEEPNCDLLVAMCESLGYETEIANDGYQALAKVKFDIDLVLLVPT